MSSALTRSFEESEGAIDVDSVRTQFTAAMAEDGRKLPQIARESGIPQGTLYAWHAGNYEGSNENVARRVLTWLVSRTAKQEVKATMPAEPPFQLTRTALRIHQTLEHAQMMPDIVEITGMPGTGKTVACRAYCQKMPNAWMITGEPVINTLTFLLSKISVAAGGQPGGTKAVLHTWLNNRFNASNGLLIIDQTEYLSEEHLDQIRMFHDSAKIGIAFVGTEAVSRKLGLDGGSQRLSQLHRRIGLRLNRKRPVKEDVETILTGWKLTGAEERQYLLGVALKPGGLGKMTKVLRMAFALGMQEGHAQPSLQDLADAAQQLGVGGA